MKADLEALLAENPFRLKCKEVLGRLDDDEKKRFRDWDNEPAKRALIYYLHYNGDFNEIVSNIVKGIGGKVSLEKAMALVVEAVKFLLDLVPHVFFVERGDEEISEIEPSSKRKVIIVSPNTAVVFRNARRIYQSEGAVTSKHPDLGVPSAGNYLATLRQVGAGSFGEDGKGFVPYPNVQVVGRDKRDSDVSAARR